MINRIAGFHRLDIPLRHPRGVRGYREWDVEDGYLAGWGGAWRSPRAHADCLMGMYACMGRAWDRERYEALSKRLGIPPRPERPHRSPDEHCDCGLRGQGEFVEVPRLPRLAGAVVGTGKVLWRSSEWRASRQTIVALVPNPADLEQHQATIDELAERYHAPLWTPKKLAAWLLRSL